MTPEADRDFASRCAELCPGFVAGSPVRARKSELLTGELAGAPVIAKRLRRSNAVWNWYFAHEVAIYRAFVATTPPFPVPRVIAVTDDVIVIERLPIALAKLRRPSAALPTATVEQLIALHERIAGYAFPDAPAPAGKVKAQLDQRLLEDPTDPTWISGGLARCNARGLIDDDALAAAEAALAAHAPIATSHGDLLLRNAMERPDGTIVLVDWECAGPHVADWDLALLWTQLAPPGRGMVEATIEGVARRRAFAALTVFALCREVVFLDAFRTPDDHAGRRQVEADLRGAVARLG